MSRLFLGGLSWGTDDARLREVCERFGAVTEAKVIMDRETGRSRGFGFVTFAVPAEAAKAQQALDGTNLDGRTIRVNEAEARRNDTRGGGSRDGGPREDHRAPTQGWRREEPQAEATVPPPEGSRRREPPPERAFAEPRNDTPPPRPREREDHGGARTPKRSGRPSFQD